LDENKESARELDSLDSDDTVGVNLDDDLGDDENKKEVEENDDETVWGSD